MKQLILKPGFIAFVFIISCATTSRFSQKYPYGLLTQDYGILNEDDLGIYAWLTTEPSPFSPESFNPAYMYWQCFPSQYVKLGCQRIESDDSNNPYSDADIVIETDSEIHEYGFRRAIDLNACKAYLKNWQRLARGENAVCFGGKPVDTEIKLIHGRRKKITGWIYDKLKTKKGCYSYFGKHCNIEYWRSRGYPDSKLK